MLPGVLCDPVSVPKVVVPIVLEIPVVCDPGVFIDPNGFPKVAIPVVPNVLKFLDPPVVLVVLVVLVELVVPVLPVAPPPPEVIVVDEVLSPRLTEFPLGIYLKPFA